MPRTLEMVPATGISGWTAPNHVQGFRATFSSGRLELAGEPRARRGGAWSSSLELVRISRPGAGAVLVDGPSRERASASRLEWTRGGLTEWYVNRPEGLEQGFDLETPPAGDRRRPFAVEMAVEGAGVHLAPDGQSLTLRGPRDAELVRISHLKVTDARGRILPSCFDAVPGRLLVVVDDRAATYPIVIDPLLSSSTTILEGTSAGGRTGAAVSRADVFDDGLSGVLVGSPSHGATGAGRVQFFRATGGGVDTSASWTYDGSQASEGVGTSVAGIPSATGGPGEDILVGAPAWDGGQTDEGAVRVFYAASPTPNWSWEPNVGGAQAGTAVAGIGDVNGDGYDDIAVGAPGYTNTDVGEGAVFVFHGSAAGFPSSPSWTWTSGAIGAHAGASVAWAGDVNGDGYDDLVAGAPDWVDVTGKGRVLVFHGGAAGLATTPSTDIPSDSLGSLGNAVSSAGDVNGDGYADVVAGDPEDSASTGRVLLFHGSPSGVSLVADEIFTGVFPGDELGFDVAGGDFDGDGYSDVIIGAPGDSGTGKVSFMRGTPGLMEYAFWDPSESGVSRFGEALAWAGDIDGDGFGDAIVGSPDWDDGSLSIEGAAFVYRGEIEGLTEGESFSSESDIAGARLGTSVAVGGDWNGDGHDDLAVGAPDQPGMEGRVALYCGGPYVPSSSPCATLFGNESGGKFGRAVAIGDWNGDGLADVAVGEPYGPSAGGRVAIFRGVQGGTPLDDVELSSIWGGDGFGAALASAGDVNGDGYADLLVGKPNAFDTLAGEGGVALYLGSASGLVSASWLVTGGAAGAALGTSVASAGDVNGDGYSDIIAGAPGWSNGQSAEGQARLWLGGPAGPSVTPDWIYESDETDADLGSAVSTAGDVNGDGFAEIAVGRPGHVNAGLDADAGGILVFDGSAAGPSTTPDFQDEGFNAVYRSGSSLAPGDFNADGYSDLIVGEPGAMFGSATSYFGSASGFPGSDIGWPGPSEGSDFGATAAGGFDFNGDGIADFVVGAPLHSNGDADEGAVLVFLGGYPFGSREWAPRVLRPSSLQPVATGGAVSTSTGFRVSLLGRNPFGRQEVGGQLEVRDLGTPFTAPQVTASAVDSGTPGAFGSVVDIALDAASPPAGPIDWRARLYGVGPARGWTSRWVAPAAPGRADLLALPDGDLDGVPDSLDNCVADANDDQADADGDLRGDACDGCPNDFDPSPVDTDADGTDDACDPDDDGDGVLDGGDNCPLVPNAGQEDTDGQGDGDACDADDDADEIDDLSDNCPLVWNNGQENADGDQAGDACDNCPGVSATQEDADSDGVGDACDNCTFASNPGQEDADLDGVGDACDTNDADADGVLDASDNCPFDANAGQEDGDADGVGDACDDCPDDADPQQVDFDGDGVGNACDGCDFAFDPGQADGDADGAGDACDNCLSASNPSQSDLDDDGDGDACDNCPSAGNPSQTDADGDGSGDPCDTCPGVSNPGNLDSDADGLGDACDNCDFVSNAPQSDADADAAGDACDNCPSTSNGSQVDADGDSRGDACDNCPSIPNGPSYADTDADTRGDACDNCPAASNVSQADADGDGRGDACDNCPSAANGPSYADADADGRGDACDNCPAVANAPSFTDTDADGRGNACDNCATIANGPAFTDTDADGLGDACDPCPLAANPSPADADGDGKPDACDNCPAHANASQADADADGRGDACDNCPSVANGPSFPDGDADNRGDACDNCPVTANASQSDGDGDGRGDTCDNCLVTPNASQSDLDADGLGDACDACPQLAGASQLDQDGDGVGNACDNCPAISNASQADPDADGKGTACDNCPAAANASQADADGDSLGDACDPCPSLAAATPDSDGDGRGDACDNCPSVSNATQVDQDGDGAGNACDACPSVPSASPAADADADGVGDACDNCATVSNASQADGDLDDSGDACDNCPSVSNPLQQDPDADARGTACDNCPAAKNAGQEDADSDGDGDACDNCPSTSNGTQADGDGDLRGDACDNCPAVANASQADLDADGQGDACEPAPPTVHAVTLSPDPTGGAPSVTLRVTASDAGGAVTALEWFLDAAGDAGTGTPISVSPAQDVDVSSPIPLSDVDDGSHQVHVRARDASGGWSAPVSGSFLKSPAVLPVVLVHGWHATQGGAHPDALATWKSLIETRLGRPVVVVGGLDAWGTPQDNAPILRAAVEAAAATTPAGLVDVVSHDAGAFTIREMLERGGAPFVRRAVFVAGQHGGWELADELYGALLQLSAAGNAAAQSRLASDLALKGLTTLGAETFDATHRRLDLFPDVAFVQVAADRPPSGTDDTLSVASALALSGGNVSSRTWSESLAAAPLHDRVLTSSEFFDDHLAPALGAGTVSLPHRARGAALAPTSGTRSTADRTVTRVVLAETAPTGKFSTTTSVTESEQATFTQVTVGDESTTELTSPTGDKFTSGTTTTSVTSIDSTSSDGLDESGYAVTDPADGDWTLEAETDASAITYGKFGDVSPLSVTTSVSSTTVSQGAAVTVTAALLPAEATVSLSQATFRSPVGAATTVTLRDDGAGGDPTAGDHRFTGSFAVPVAASSLGRWSVDGRIAGTLSGTAYDRTSSALFDATSGEIAPTGSYSSTLLDTDGDGGIDVIRVSVGVQINQAGEYQVAGELTSSTGKFAGQASSVVQASSPQAVTVPLDFDAGIASSQGIGGKLQLSSLVLANATGALTVVSSGVTGFETQTIDPLTLEVDPRPIVRVTSPTSSSPLVRTSFTIAWDAADPDSDAVVSLFLDSDAEGYDGVPIAGAQSLSEDSTVRSFTLDVSTFPEGEYFVQATITDGSTTRRAYSSGPIRVGTDTDGDGLLDSYENARGTDAGAADALADPDFDSLTNGTEAGIGTLPQDADTDNGGESEGREVLYSRNPLAASDDLVLPGNAILGDVNPATVDGRVRASDIVRIIRFARGLQSPTAVQMLRADVAPAVPTGTGTAMRLGNARLTSDDVVQAVQVLLGKVRLTDRW